MIPGCEIDADAPAGMVKTSPRSLPPLDPRFQVMNPAATMTPSRRSAITAFRRAAAFLLAAADPGARPATVWLKVFSIEVPSMRAGTPKRSELHAGHAGVGRRF